MIIGSGLLAKACQKNSIDNTEICIFASGVSNSNCVEFDHFAREKNIDGCH